VCYSDLQLGPGKQLGGLLDELTERVVAEPALNDRAILLDLARELMSNEHMVENPQS
jgi:hypothetical protein